MRSEYEMIARLHSLFQAHKGRVGIGDDAAVLEDGLLISTDAVSEQVHFLRSDASWAEVAYKLFASNASDMAAMGGKAEGYFLSLGIPFDWEDSDLDAFTGGVQEFLRSYPADLLGGDLVRCPVFFGAVTVIGRAFQKPWLRSGAKDGDFVYVTGSLGDSRLYLHRVLGRQELLFEDEAYFRGRHYKPSPRADWAEIIGKTMDVHAAMDISDGLAEDLAKLCGSSGCFYTLDAAALPMSAAHIGRERFDAREADYRREALIGGEDYELIIVSPSEAGKAAEGGVPLTKVGRICSHGCNTVRFFDNEYNAQHFKGYSHS